MKLADALVIARETEVPVPSAAHRDEIRAAVLAGSTSTRPVATAARPRRRRAWIAAAAVAAAIAIVVIATRRGGGEVGLVTHRGSVVAVGSGATFTTTVLPDETVRLTEGTIAVTVAPLHAGERFRVIVGDGEVEVRGTAFEVEAHGDHLARVRVDHGRVEVRPRGGAMRVLGADEQWVSATEIARVDGPAAAAPAIASTMGSTSKVVSTFRSTSTLGSTSTSRSTSATSRGSAIVATQHVPAPPIARGMDAIAFDEAWDAMRAQQFAPAAIAFARVVAIEPAGPLADDARFWSAVAHSRAKHAPLAIAAFRELVDQHATSAHAAEAAAMLGWLLLEISPRTPALTAEARDRFTTALGATSPRVRASAQTGLDQLDK